MDDETLKACQLAIKARIKHLNWFHLRNSPQSERAGLLLCSHALGLLASRFIQEPDWPGHDVTDDVRLNWELQWYFDYVKAILEVSRAAQIAVRDKRLILRSQLTRTALNTKNLDDWLSRDLEAAQVDAMKGFFPGVMELCLVGSVWPDSCCLPPGAAYAQDIAAWAVADGLATSGDALALLLGTMNAKASALVEPASTIADIAPAVAIDALGKPATNWRHPIQAEAYEHWIRLLAAGCSPTVHSILDGMAKWCVENNVKTATGIFPRAGYIKNTVLGGRNWRPPTMSHEQARTHVAQLAQVAQPEVVQVAHR